MSSTIEEDFELELRSLPGVVNVGIVHSEEGDVESVVLTIRNHDPDVVRESATQVASLYYPDAVVILEETRAARADRARRGNGGPVSRWRRPSSTSTTASARCASASPAGSGSGGPGAGRSSAGPRPRCDALRDLGNVIPFYLMGVTKVDTVIGRSVIVALRSLAANDDRMGIALAHDDLLASAKATLDALNRFLSLDPDRRRAATGEIESRSGEAPQYSYE